MKKRLAKVLALGLTAAMFAGAPLSAMASEVNAADQAGETAVVAESADSADETEVDAGIASQDLMMHHRIRWLTVWIRCP